MHWNYWSPASPEPEVTDMLIGDGGDVLNANIISFLLRGMTNIIMFGHFVTPLRTSFNVSEPSWKHLETQYPGFFGIELNEIGWDEYYGIENGKNQVFATEEWPILAQKLKEAQDPNGPTKGTGIIVTTEHTTVANPWYGVKAGIKVNVTWVYMSRLPAWEEKLSEDMRKRIQPRKPEELHNTKLTGEFANFPHFKTSAGGMSYRQANIVASMQGWSVLQNADIFREILKPVTKEPSMLEKMKPKFQGIDLASRFKDRLRPNQAKDDDDDEEKVEKM